MPLARAVDYSDLTVFDKQEICFITDRFVDMLQRLTE